jgi:hypothetical protein
MRFINTFIHGVEDYLLAALLIAAPYLLGFADGSSAQYVPQAIGVMIFLTSIFTRYELGLVRIIPMPIHLMLDAGAAILLAASPWLFGFSERIYLPHLILGLGELLVVACSQTEWNERRSEGGLRDLR